jgi:hypothetical protein
MWPMENRIKNVKNHKPSSEMLVLNSRSPSNSNIADIIHLKNRSMVAGPIEPAASHALSSPRRVVHLKERNLNMLKNDLILRNPLQLVQSDVKDATLPIGGFGAVLARAGVGKTALLVQVSLNSLLEGRNVLHISLDDPVNKVNLWYSEVFSHIAKQYNVRQTSELWESLLPHRFIMTFRVEGFSVPKLDERLTDLIEQDIFVPHIIILDGLPFDTTVRSSLLELKNLTHRHGCHAWFTVRTHRDEPLTDTGIPSQLAESEDLFDVILQLNPEGKVIHVNLLKGKEKKDMDTGLILDPSTMLITERD